MRLCMVEQVTKDMNYWNFLKPEVSSFLVKDAEHILSVAQS